MNILHLDSSPRGERSHSRRLSGEAVGLLKAALPGAQVVTRDLGHHPVPGVTEAWIAAAYSDPATHTPELKEALALSNALVDEFLAADIIVAGMPMYNFSVPAQFKAYIDQIVRVNRTFSAQTGGLAGGRKILFVTARGYGGYGPGDAMESSNFENPYLLAIFGFMGIAPSDITFADMDQLSDEGRDAVIEKARAAIAEFAQKMGAAQA